jgi:(1->4)-alpha-D-glucan 1-alpha-D-glucosylmutase
MIAYAAMSVPLATYRVQLHAGFGFDEVAAIAPYLAELGVSHVYCSPYLQAAPGSTHGYDVVDHSRLNEELGGEAAYERMVKALAEQGLGQVLDIVPNHMSVAAGRRNRWWWDVLENGPSSRWASFFDVDWSRTDPKVLLPVLGDHYGRVLDWGEFRVVREGGSFVVHYFEHEAPISPRTLDDLLGAAAVASGSDELASIAVAFGRLPPATATDLASVEERHRDKEVFRSHLAWLLDDQPAVAEAVDRELAAVNADPDRLDALLLRQNYRFAFWQSAGQSIDYRRFFDINELVGLNVDEPRVFEEAHELVLRLVSDLRIDHPDGLLDPAAYLTRLRSRVGDDAYIVVEKILEAGEALPPSWPVQGTTGYDFVNLATGLFVDPAGEAPLTELYRDFTGEEEDFAEVAYAAKQQVMRQSLAADLDRLTALAVTVCERRRSYRDYTRRELHDVLREVAACFGVYRTYVTPGGAAPSAADVAAVESAVAEASRRRPEFDPLLLAFVRDLLLGCVEGPTEAELAQRFQQFSAPVMAKGVEDTAFYRYFRLVALNEVGGDPGRFSVAVEDFHRHNVRMAVEWPATMLASSTHDTKRSEDVRLRIALLSEIPAEWAGAVRRWSARNRQHGDIGPNTEYLLYQTLVGAWPLGVDRAQAYMEKAVKEAKRQTSWVAPDAEYEAAVQAFVAAVLDDAAFVADLEAFVAPLVEAGRTTSLSQTLLKLTAPGVPDIYQGTEDWDLSLVDPDNRRPVDYAALAHSDSPKRRLVTRALAARRRRREAFAPGASYEPLYADGAKAAHAVAYVRGGSAVVVAPRLVLGLGGDWGDTAVTLPPGRWVDDLGGERRWEGRVLLRDFLAGFPVALLGRDDP